MSQLQDIGRILVSAGAHVDPRRKGVLLLFVDAQNKNSLISQLWDGKRFDEKELIASSVRPNSTAAYLLKDSTDEKAVVYISSESTLCFARYDDEEEEWTTDDSIPKYQVHLDGKVTSVISSGGIGHVFFQNRSKQLVHLDEGTNWAQTILPVQPLDGAPLLAMDVEGQVNLYYIGLDNHMRCVYQGQGSGWTDKSLSFAFEERVKQFALVTEGDGSLVPIALTEQSQMVWFNADGNRTILGSVNSEGRFVPSTSEESTPGFRCRGCRGIRCSLFDFTNLRVIPPGELNEESCEGM